MKKIAKVDGVPAPRAPYSTYAQAGNLIFVAGQVAMQGAPMQSKVSSSLWVLMVSKGKRSFL